MSLYGSTKVWFRNEYWEIFQFLDTEDGRVTLRKVVTRNYEYAHTVLDKDGHVISDEAQS